MFIGCKWKIGSEECLVRPALVPPIPGLVYLWPGVPMPGWCHSGWENALRNKGEMGRIVDDTIINQLILIRIIDQNQFPDMGMGQNLLVSILMGWTSILTQLFCGSLGTRVMTHSHIVDDLPTWNALKIGNLSCHGYRKVPVVRLYSLTCVCPRASKIIWIPN